MGDCDTAYFHRVASGRRNKKFTGLFGNDAGV